MSLKFLNLKSFHPTNKANQKRLFIAEQKAVSDKKREEERGKEYIQEQEYINNRAAVTGSKLEGERSKVGFLYAPPPGAKIEKEGDKENALLGKANGNNGGDGKKQQLTDVEKFPFLANAPVQGDYTGSIKVTHKPFGIELRDVKCIRCGNYGHKSGDRECPLFDMNPNDLKRLEREDPLASSDYSNNNNKRKSRDDDSDNSDDDEVMREFLETLTKRQRKLLLRQIKKEEKEKKKKDKKEKKSSKKQKISRNNKRDYDSDGSSSSISSDDDSDSDR